MRERQGKTTPNVDAARTALDAMPPGGEPTQRALDAALMVVADHDLQPAEALALLMEWNAKTLQLRDDQVQELLDLAVTKVQGTAPAAPKVAESRAPQPERPHK